MTNKHRLDDLFMPVLGEPEKVSSLRKALMCSLTLLSAALTNESFQKELGEMLDKKESIRLPALATLKLVIDFAEWRDQVPIEEIERMAQIDTENRNAANA